MIENIHLILNEIQAKDADLTLLENINMISFICR